MASSVLAGPNHRFSRALNFSMLARFWNSTTPSWWRANEHRTEAEQRELDRDDEIGRHVEDVAEQRRQQHERHASVQRAVDRARAEGHDEQHPEQALDRVEVVDPRRLEVGRVQHTARTGDRRRTPRTR